MFKKKKQEPKPEPEQKIMCDIVLRKNVLIHGICNNENEKSIGNQLY